MYSRDVKLGKLGDERHLYLYAKKWYVPSKNLMNDLKKIVSRITGVPYKYVNENSVIYWVSKTAAPHMGLAEDAFIDFVEEIFKYTNISTKSLVRRMLVMLSLARVIDDRGRILIELGDPDDSIFSRKQKG